MSTPRLFCHQIDAGEVALSPEETHHAAHVLRLQPGDEVALFDGRGTEALGRVGRLERGTVIVSVGRVGQRGFELRHRVTLAVGMGRQHRQGYLVEKCTELGVAAIQPIMAGRSVARPGDHAVEKWSKRAIEAAKQSGRAWVPVIHPIQSFPQVIDRVGSFSAAFIADVGSEAVEQAAGGSGVISWSSALGRQPDDAELLVLIGPEGGWSDDERVMARSAGVVAVSLAPTILRTETAAVAVCAAAAMASVIGLPKVDSF